jgi:hypothetical protein
MAQDGVKKEQGKFLKDVVIPVAVCARGWPGRPEVNIKGSIGGKRRRPHSAITV